MASGSALGSVCWFAIVSAISYLPVLPTFIPGTRGNLSDGGGGVNPGTPEQRHLSMSVAAQPPVRTLSPLGELRQRERCDRPKLTSTRDALCESTKTD
jgi:hypothetical protein